jgi:hypothetical protein
LRATGGRELLLIFNPQGVLVHEELLERRRGRAPRVGLFAAGRPMRARRSSSIAECRSGTTSAHVERGTKARIAGSRYAVGGYCAQTAQN